MYFFEEISAEDSDTYEEIMKYMQEKIVYQNSSYYNKNGCKNQSEIVELKIKNKKID